MLDDPHLVMAGRYVERNPVKARLVRRAEHWPWSSAAAHAAGKGDAGAESDWLSEMTGGWVCTWRQFLRTSEDEEFRAAMRRHEATGRPMGDKAFLTKMEALLGRPLLPKPRGRPREQKEHAGK